MNIENEISVICETLNITETEFAKEIGVTNESINNWKNGIKSIDKSNLEKLYSYAYLKGIRLNSLYIDLGRKPLSL